MSNSLNSAICSVGQRGISIEIDVNLEGGDRHQLYIKARAGGAKDWRYVVTNPQGQQWRLDTDDFLHQPHKMGFDHCDIFDVSFVTNQVMFLGTELGEAAAKARWNEAQQIAA
jgi:hypothetical protein